MSPRSDAPEGLPHQLGDWTWRVPTRRLMSILRWDRRRLGPALDVVRLKKIYLKIVICSKDDKCWGWAAGRRRRNLKWIWIFQHLNGTSRKGCLYAKRPLQQVVVPGQPFSTLMGMLRNMLEDVLPILIRWPINRSNRFSDFLRLDRLDRFGKIIKSIFSKFWKREFQFFSDFHNYFGFLKFREFFFFVYNPNFLETCPVSL